MNAWECIILGLAIGVAVVWVINVWVDWDFERRYK